VAYQVIGDGPTDLVFMPFFGRWNLDLIWEYPPLERFLRRLASFSRLILLNPRGSALSDPIPRGVPAPEDWVLDVRLVLDAVGSEQTSLFAIEASCQPAVFFAASFPDRTTALVTLNGEAMRGRADDYPWGMPSEVAERFQEITASTWGTGQSLDFMAPELAKDERFREWWARLERTSTSAAVIRTYSIPRWDMRGVLPSIQAPTLVIQHTDVPWIRVGHGRYLAEHIPNARYIERPGSWGGVYWVQDVDWVLDEVQTFLTGAKGAASFDERVLATVLFTDIVGSTKRAIEVGDRSWRDLLDEHDEIVRREIERFRGRRVKSTGDGVLATFDGPARAIRCALELRDAVRTLGLEIRTGLHTGEIEVRGEDVAGIAVVIGARVMTEAGAGEVLVSAAVPPLVVGSGLEFDDRGAHALKGVPGAWRLFAVRI
jgi:class 3 adenylate cyclase